MAQFAQAQASAARTLEAFREAKDANGAPRHPHYADVEADMAALARADATEGKPIDLDGIYDRAVWANPEVRNKTLEQRDKARHIAADRKRKEQAKKAKAASTEVKAAPDGGAGTEPTSLREDLRQGLRSEGGA